MRTCILLLAVVALAVAPATGTVYVTNGTNPQNVQINLQIGCYTQVYWNGTADQVINFGQTDWASPVLVGQYTGSQDSGSAWATGYFESTDSAFFWLDSNCSCLMTLTSTGNLEGQNTHFLLPTWFTMCLTNNTNCVGANCGFIDGGARQSCEQIPGDGYGCYAEDVAPTDGAIELFPGARFPLQYPFPMAGAPVWTGAFAGHAQGTILFHARVLRNGMADPADNYTTDLAVAFQ